MTGDFEKIKLFAKITICWRCWTSILPKSENQSQFIGFYMTGIAEIVDAFLNLINQTIKGAGFRDKFNVNVLVSAGRRIFVAGLGQ